MFDSWLPEGTGGSCQLLKKPRGLGLGYGRGHRSEPASRACVACVHLCMSMCGAAGTPWGPEPATGQTECARMVTGGIQRVCTCVHAG